MGLSTGCPWDKRMYQKKSLTSRVSWFNQVGVGTNQTGMKGPACCVGDLLVVVIAMFSKAN